MFADRCKHALALLVGTTAAEEGNENGRYGNNQEEDDSTGVDRDTHVSLKNDCRIASHMSREEIDWVRG